MELLYSHTFKSYHGHDSRSDICNLVQMQVGVKEENCVVGGLGVLDYVLGCLLWVGFIPFQIGTLESMDSRHSSSGHL